METNRVLRHSVGAGEEVFMTVFMIILLKRKKTKLLDYSDATRFQEVSTSYTCRPSFFHFFLQYDTGNPNIYELQTTLSSHNLIL